MTNVASGHGQGHHRRGVLVTGASHGVGAEVPRTFANLCGDRVAVHWRRSRVEADVVRESLDGDGHVVVQGDLASPRGVRKDADDLVEIQHTLRQIINVKG